MSLISSFVFNGFDVFSCSARGEYGNMEERAKKADRELLGFKIGNFKTDRQNLRSDRKAVALDMRNVFDRLVTT